jgi:hypothetical protein
MQFFFEMQQFVHLAFQQLRYGNAGPPADDRGDVSLIHLFFEEAWTTRGMRLRKLLFEFTKLAVAKLGDPVEIVCTFSLLDFKFRLFELLAEAPQPLDGFLFVLPLRL